MAKVTFERKRLDWNKDILSGSIWYAYGQLGRWEIRGASRYRVILYPFSKLGTYRWVGGTHSSVAAAQKDAEERDVEKPDNRTLWKEVIE